MFNITDSEKYRWTENTTWGENYAGSSGLQHQNYPQQMPTGHNNASKVGNIYRLCILNTLWQH